MRMKKKINMYKNYFTGEAAININRNVPDGAEIIGNSIRTNGEIILTFYCQRYEPAHKEYGHWALWKVFDWVTDQPQPTSMFEVMCALPDLKINGDIS